MGKGNEFMQRRQMCISAGSRKLHTFILQAGRPAHLPRRREEQVAIGDRTRQTFFATDNSGCPGGQTFLCNLNQLLLQVVLQHEAMW